MGLRVNTAKKLNSTGLKNVGEFIKETTIRFWNELSKISDFNDLCDNDFELKLSGYSSRWLPLDSLKDCAILQDTAIGCDIQALDLHIQFIFTEKTQKTITDTDICRWGRQLRQQLPDFCHVHVCQDGSAITCAMPVGHSTPINILSTSYDLTGQPALGFVAVYLLTDDELEDA